MTIHKRTKLSPENGNGTLKVRSAYLEKIQDTLSKALSKMDLYDDGIYIQKFGKRGTRLPFYPHVELGTEPVETECIQDLQKIRPFGANLSTTANETKSESTVTSRKRESCLIQSTSNSVRVSFLFKAQARARQDPLEASIVFQWMRFLMVQEQHPLLRKVPIEGYSVTFLITNKHLAIYGREGIEDSILGFCAKIDKECSDIKLQVNAQARYVTTEFLKAFNNQVDLEEEKNNV